MSATSPAAVATVRLPVVRPTPLHGSTVGVEYADVEIVTTTYADPGRRIGVEVEREPFEEPA